MYVSIYTHAVCYFMGELPSQFKLHSKYCFSTACCSSNFWNCIKLDKKQAQTGETQPSPQKCQEYGFQSPEKQLSYFRKVVICGMCQLHHGYQVQENLMDMHSSAWMPSNHLSRVVMWSLFIDLIYVGAQPHSLINKKSVACIYMTSKASLLLQSENIANSVTQQVHVCSYV